MLIFGEDYEVLCIVDGDGFKAVHKVSKTLVEFRMYGIDAPEVKKCKKLSNDEKMLRLPGQLLVELGNKAAQFLRSIIWKGVTITMYRKKAIRRTFTAGNCVRRIYLMEDV